MTYRLRVTCDSYSLMTRQSTGGGVREVGFMDPVHLHLLRAPYVHTLLRHFFDFRHSLPRRYSLPRSSLSLSVGLGRGNRGTEGGLPGFQALQTGHPQSATRGSPPAVLVPSSGHPHLRSPGQTSGTTLVPPPVEGRRRRVGRESLEDLLRHTRETAVLSPYLRH